VRFDANRHETLHPIPCDPDLAMAVIGSIVENTEALY
jgi:hypothetical protein